MKSLTWVVFEDLGYFKMHAVKVEGDKDESPHLFHLATNEEAVRLANLLNIATFKGFASDDGVAFIG